MATAAHDLDLDRRRTEFLASIGHPLPEHANYPHQPGQLFDCPACESACFCTAQSTECVYCASLEH